MQARTLARSLALVLGAVLLLAACECMPQSPEGRPCVRATDCPSAGLACGFATCRAACTTSRDCRAGTSCLRSPEGADVCALATETCASGRACPTGLVCRGDHCTSACDTSADCPADQVCRADPSGTAACMALDADAGPPDASLDTGAVDAGPIASLGARDGCIGTTAACVIVADHDVYCWGSTAYGALGDGEPCAATGIPRGVPHRVVGVTGADVIACGDGFACAHQSNGETRCWGRNDLSQLARTTSGVCDATAAPVLTATDAPLVVATADLAIGGAHGCLLSLPSGAIQCWGRNDGVLDVRASADPSSVFARASDALQPLRDAPTTPLPAASVTGLAVGATGAIARITGRDLYLWGANDHLETASTPGPRLTAVLSTGAGRGTFAIAGLHHRCALDAGGVICWGADDLSQLGHTPSASAMTCGTIPCEAPGAAQGSFTSIATSGEGDTSCGIVAGGSTVRCWGDNTHGLAGVSGVSMPTATLTSATPTVPLPAAVRTPLLRIFVGPRSACAIDSGSVPWCWGDHDLDATSASLATPVAIAIPGA